MKTHSHILQETTGFSRKIFGNNFTAPQRKVTDVDDNDILIEAAKSFSAALIVLATLIAAAFVLL